VAIFRAEQAGVVHLRTTGDAALVVLEVDDVDAEAGRLGDLVVAGPVSRPDWGGRVAHVRDPDGNLFELFQTIPMEEE
jgi:lactoylglutathione lyase